MKKTLSDAFEIKAKEVSIKNEPTSDYGVFKDKELLDSLRNKVIQNIIANDLRRPAKDIELIEQEFESELRKYQLLKIMELNS